MLPARRLSVNEEFKLWQAVPHVSIAAVVVVFSWNPSTHQAMVNFMLTVFLSVLRSSCPAICLHEMMVQPT